MPLHGSTQALQQAASTTALAKEHRTRCLAMVTRSSERVTRSSGAMTDLFDMLACILEKPELGCSGQPNGQRILGRRQLLNIKDGVIWLQEDRPQVCN